MPASGNMDVLTGRIVREVYFDPSKLVGKDGKPLTLTSSSVDEAKQAEMLYKPVKVVQEFPNEKVVVVRDEMDQVHRLKAEGLLTVKAEAKQGVPDILDLNDFSGRDGGREGGRGLFPISFPHRLKSQSRCLLFSPSLPPSLPSRNVLARDPPFPLHPRRGLHLRRAHPHQHQPIQVEPRPLLRANHDPLPHLRERAAGPSPL